MTLLLTVIVELTKEETASYKKYVDVKMVLIDRNFTLEQ